MRLLVHLICALLLYQANGQYTQEDTEGCVFPFKFNGLTYEKCTNVGSYYNWCSPTSDFIGVWKYCNDQRISDWKCLDACTISGADEYPSCLSNYNNRRMYCTDQINYPLESDSQMVSADCPDKYKTVPFHTRCLTPAKYMTKEGINEEEKQKIVDLHDEWRSNADVPASQMMKMYWDDELAAIAQRHASRCSFNHDQVDQRSIPGTGLYSGQNIVIIVGVKNFNLSTQFENMYRVEKPRWLYGEGVIQKYKIYNRDAGHYTQLLVDHINKIGCGQATCVYADRKETLYVCNYNFMQYEHELIHPYEKGEWCSKCKDKCVGGRLCDCGAKECYNGGHLDPNTCQCTCKGFWKGDSCETEIVSQKQSNGCMIPFLWDDKLRYDCMPDPDMYYDYPICSSKAHMTYETIIECKQFQD